MKLLKAPQLEVVAEQVILADGIRQRLIGLLGQSGLPNNQVLWLKPCNNIHTIGMQFPIDVVFLDHKLCVKKTVWDLKPWRLSFCLSAHSTLEWQAPSPIRFLKEGDQLVIND